MGCNFERRMIKQSINVGSCEEKQMQQTRDSLKRCAPFQNYIRHCKVDAILLYPIYYISFRRENVFYYHLVK